MKNYLKNIFSLDLRSLALFRVFIGGILIADLIIRAFWIKDFYSDAGILPRSEAMIDAKAFSLSIHLISGLWQIQLVIFVIAAIFVLMLLIGYKTKIATIASWFLFMSLGNRNIWVESAADQLLRLLLFWSMFLPLGARYSIDSLKHEIRQLPNRYFSIASLAFTLQMNFMYLFTAIFKFNPIWIRDGTAVYYAMHNYIFLTPIGDLMNKYLSWSFKYLTYIVYAVEAIGFYFLYSPFKTGLVRTIAILIFIVMHITFGLGMYLGIFSYVVVAGFCALLPSYFWDTLQRFTKYNEQQKLTIYYDNDCGFCQRVVRFLKTFLLLNKTEVIPAQVNEQVKNDMVNKDSWIVIDGSKKRYYKFDAIIPLSKTSPLLYLISPILSSAVVRKIGKPIYELIASHRKSLCPINRESVLSAPRKSWNYHFLSAFILFCLFFIIWHNVYTISSKKEPQSNLINQVGFLLGLHQRWNMFAPHPSLDNYWLVIPGRLKNGQYVDLYFYGQPVTYDSPYDSGRLYENSRWAKYLANLTANKGPKYSSYSKYLCRKWNGTHSSDEQLQDMKFYLMHQKINLEGKEEKISKSFFYWWRCV